MIHTKGFPKNLFYLIPLFIFLSIIEFQPKNSVSKSFFDDLNQPASDLAEKPIAIVGDLQKTSFFEIIMGRESNDEERVRLVEEISLQNPAMMVVLGDMVFDGSDPEQWQEFDSLLIPVKKEHIPVYPVLGNHEYWGYNGSCERNFKIRFSSFNKCGWYVQEYDSLALVFLNSNESDMPGSEWKEQQLWFKKIMAEYDSDPAIKGVIVNLHHPPYTNSIITADELHVQLAFVPAYLKSKKGLAMISGHAHTYERFMKNGKMFIVSGGGGGPRVGLRDGIDFHKDLYTGKSPRPFHFLLINRDETGVKVTVRGLNKKATKFFTMEEYYLKLQNYPEGMARHKIAKLQD